MAKEIINVGLMGCGTVGGGLVHLMLANSEFIKERTGMTIAIKKILVKDPSKRRTMNLPPLPSSDLSSNRRKTKFSDDGISPKQSDVSRKSRVIDQSLFTDKSSDILNDREIDIVVELIGGVEPARKLVLEAISRKKFIVTANKALLANSGEEIFQAVEKYGVRLGFEASVCGGIPIIRSIQDGLIANRINLICGIVNGTSNYILTRMTMEGVPFDKALAIAQEKGFAEKDPSLDIEGWDATQKLAILAMLAFGIRVDWQKIHTEGIKNITADDIKSASEFGYTIKHLAIAKDTPGGIELRVHPTLLTKNHPLANVANEFNAVLVRGNAIEDMLFYGKGAGALPTASAVLSDIIELAAVVPESADFAYAEKASGQNHTFFWSKKALADISQSESEYYLRVPIFDKPGAIGAITSILGEHSISISKLDAQLVSETKNAGNVNVLIHKCTYKQIEGAIKGINKIPHIRSKSALIRIGY